MKKLHDVATRFLVLNLMLFSLLASAQTPEQARKIAASYNQAYLQNLATQLLEESTKKKKEAIAYAHARNIPITYTTKEGAFAELQEILPDGTLRYNITDNADAAKSTRVNHLNMGGSTGYNLEGQNMVAYVWDGGHPRVTHQEYDGPGGTNRVIIMDGTSDLSSHAAHVIGTITASGLDPQAKGMAPRSTLKAYEWSNDLGEAATEAAGGMLISNHSYGQPAANLTAQDFGSYKSLAQQWDNLMFNAPYFLMIKSAGNDGYETYLNSSPLSTGYDMLNGRKTAKNNLVVANAQDAVVDSNGNFISLEISGSSSPGPTDDLRIKPDISGNGHDVYSTIETSDNAYGYKTGTSMASPNVAGSLLLLQEHYNKLNNTFMRAATLKGLAMHTADDAGPVGPDARFGWGLLNTKLAAETITQHGTQALINEIVLTQGQTITVQVNADGINDLMASISWTDRAGAVNNGLNSSTPALVNDLDIRVSKNGTTYYPWRLTSATTNSNSGDNLVDPFERIEVANASGTYTITVSHKGNLVGGSQAFSLIVTGIQVECITASAPQGLNILEVTGETASVSWTPIPGATYDLRYRKAAASTWSTVLDIPTHTYEITGLDTFTEYEVEVRSKCASGTPSSYSAATNFTTSGLDYCNSYSSYFPVDHYIRNVSLNTIDNNSSASTYSDFTHISTELIAGETYGISIAVTAAANYGSAYAVWIDYNNDGVFDPAEKIFETIIGANYVATGTFTVPSDVDPLTTTMRVSMKSGNTIPDPCDVISYGEVEDYAIKLKVIECAASIPQNVEVVEIIGETATVNWTRIPDATYDLRYRVVGSSTWIDVLDISTHSYDLTGLNTYSEYEVEVRSKCTEGIPSAYSTAVNFTTAGLNYCDSYSSNFPTQHYISNVSLNTINNNSSASNYSDFTHISTELVPGETYGISIAAIATANYGSSYAVWIDYNNNGIFDSTEKIFTTTIGANYVATGTFSVPLDVNPLSTTMRVSMASGPTPPGPCDVITYGEVEDYAINFTPVEVCPAPTDLTLTAVTATTANIVWTAGDTETSWNVSLGVPGYTPGDANELFSTSRNVAYINFSGLVANTQYEFYVQANCGADFSEFVGPLSINTHSPIANDNLCDALPLTMGASSAGDAYTNAGATVQANEPQGSCAYGTIQSVWFSFEAPPSGNATVTTDIAGGTLNDTQITIYEAPTDCADLLTLGAEIACDQDGGGTNGHNWRSIATMTGLTAGNTYYIQVDGYGTSTGTFGLEVHDDGNDGFVYENGAWTPSDPHTNATANDDIFVMNGVTSFTSDLEVNSVTVMSGATLNVEGVLTINGDLTNNGQLVFVSSATGNGELGPVSASSTITGNATVQRYMKNKRSYRMVSSAVTTTNSIHNNWQEGATSNTNNPAPGFGTHITGRTTDQANGFDGTSTGNPSMFTVNVATQQFQAIANTHPSTLTAGKGYLLFVRGDRSIDLTNNLASSATVLRATGSLATGNKTQNFADAVNGNFVMFGNPYQSTVNVASVFGNIESNNLHSLYYYVYDPTIANHGAYVTVNYTNGTNNNGSSSANQYLQPGQAAQVQVTGPAAITFKESDKAPGNFTSTNRNPMSESNMLAVQLYTTENFNNGQASHDGFMMIFAEGNDNGLTSEDAIKPMNFYENIGIDHDGTYLSIEHRDMPQPAEVYSLYTSGYNYSDYTVKMTVDGLENTFLYLDDHYTGISTLLEFGENTYSFNVDTNNGMSIATDRFSIRTEERLGVNQNNLLAGIRLFPNPLNGNTFYINAPKLNGEQLMVSINDLSGRMIYNQTLDCQANTVTVPMGNNIASGVYMVTLKHGGETQAYRLIKE